MFLNSEFHGLSTDFFYKHINKCNCYLICRKKTTKLIVNKYILCLCRNIQQQHTENIKQIMSIEIMIH